MKKDKNGFTLIEILAVLAIIAILTAVTFPNFLSMKTDQQKKFSESLQIVIKSAAKVYVSNNKSDIDKKIENSDEKGYCMAIGTLKAYDYVDIPLYDPVSNEKIDLRRCIYISKTTTDSKVKYNYELSTDLKESDYIPPVISLKEKDGISEGTCKTIMNVASKEEFKNNCEVVATDNIDTITPTLASEEKIDDTIILKYTAEDLNGNIAKQFIIKLIIGS